MNNEIKEKIPENVSFVLEDVNSNILWYYITKLQQENERLTDSIDWWKDRFFGQQEYDDSHRITAIEYKKRIDKAIEYIENPRHEMSVLTHQNLLNILQNGSDSK